MFRICQIKYQKIVFHGQAVKTVAYLRVSTGSRTCAASASPSSSTHANTDFRIDDFIEATASGQASEKRRRLDELMNVLQRGDRLVVSELSRSVGRWVRSSPSSTPSAKAGVAFVAMKENIRVEDKRDLVRCLSVSWPATSISASWSTIKAALRTERHF